MKCFLFLVSFIVLGTVPCRAASSGGPSSDTILQFLFLGVVGYLGYLLRKSLKTPRMKKGRFREELLAGGAYIKEISAKPPDLFMAYGNSEIRIHYTSEEDLIPDKEVHRSFFTLSCAVKAPYPVDITKRGAGDRLAEGLRLGKRIATGDRDFDARFHVESDNEAFAGEYFSSPEIREAARRLFGEGCRRIELGPDGLKAVWFINQEDVTGTDFVKNSLPHLSAMAKGIVRQKVPPPPTGRFTRPGVHRVLILVRGSIIVGTVDSLVSMITPDIGFQPIYQAEIFLHSLIYSGPALAAFLLAAAAAFRGRSWFKSVFLEVAIYSTPVFLLAGYWTFCFINCRCDKAPAAEYRTKVFSTEAAEDLFSNLLNKAYTAQIEPWQGGGAFTILIPKGLYDKILGNEKEQTFVFTVKPGYLGHEWITGWKMTAIPATPNKEYLEFWGLKRVKEK